MDLGEVGWEANRSVQCWAVVQPNYDDEAALYTMTRDNFVREFLE
jgi:hypothetical protein